MAKANSIAPFPSDKDRFRFGDWLSGFVDGEGCFRLALFDRPSQPGLKAGGFASLDILLRSDDLDILKLIQSYFGCGHIRCRHIKREDRRNNPSATFTVASTKDLARMVVPHFERHPLVAKKRRDYAIWKTGVDLLYQVWQRPRQCRRGVGVGAGAAEKWTPAEREHFKSLAQTLKDQRRFESPAIEPPEVPEYEPDLPMFRGIDPALLFGESA